MSALDRYRILHEIDAGGMATVFLAEDTVLHRRVALKMVHPHLLHRPETIKRFHNEARAVATLSHENIVKVFDYGEEEDKHYLVMEYIDGVTLSEFIGNHAPLPNLVLLELVCQILAGLGAAHEKGVYHRDVKPGNIMVDRYGCVRIMDFGIAYLVSHESITMTGTFVGSPNYISPEQAEGKSITGKTDVFSLGSLAYQCATGQLPFDAENPHAIIRAIVNDRPDPPHGINGRLLHSISDFIAACLTKDDGGRPDAGECLERIEALCREDHLELGRRRLVRFMEEPDRYRREEAQELFNAYRRCAREQFKRRRMVGALKKLGQARAFGALPAADERWAASLGRRMRLRWAAVAAGLGLSIAALVVGAIHGSRQGEGNPSEVVPHRSRTASVADSSASQTNRSAGAAVAGAEDSAGTAVEDTAAAMLAQRGRRNDRLVRPDPAPERGAARTPAPAALRPRDRKGGGKGYLSIRTKPSWVTIVIDGIEAGNTARPSALPLKAGRHELVLRKEGFIDLRETIMVAPGDTVHRKIRMMPANTSTDTVAR